MTRNLICCNIVVDLYFSHLWGSKRCKCGGILRFYYCQQIMKLWGKNAYICPKSSVCDTEDIHLLIMPHKYVLLKKLNNWQNDVNRNKWCILGGFIWCTRVPAVAQKTEQAVHKFSGCWSDPWLLLWKCRCVLGQKTGP